MAYRSSTTCPPIANDIIFRSEQHLQFSMYVIVGAVVVGLLLAIVCYQSGLRGNYAISTAAIAFTPPFDSLVRVPRLVLRETSAVRTARRLGRRCRRRRSWFSLPVSLVQNINLQSSRLSRPDVAQPRGTRGIVEEPTWGTSGSGVVRASVRT